MTQNERMLAVLRHERPDAIPTFEWFIDESVGEALAGSRDPIDIVEKLDLDGINIRADYEKEFKDDKTFRDEWGTVRQLTGDCIAAVVEHPIASLASHGKYRFPDPHASSRFKTLERALERFGDSKAIVLNLRDGFSDMRDLLGYQEALMGMAVEPIAFRDLLMRSVEYNLALAELAVKRYGIKIVGTTDDVCTAAGPFLSVAMYEDVLAPAFIEVMRGFKQMGLLIIKHCDGNVLPLLDLWIEAGIDCLDPIDPGAGMDMGEMKQKYGHKIALKGNIDCTGVLCTGTYDENAEAVRECIEKGGEEGGLILSSSNTIHRGVKPGNYMAMLEALREYGRYA